MNVREISTADLRAIQAGSVAAQIELHERETVPRVFKHKARYVPAPTDGKLGTIRPWRGGIRLDPAMTYSAGEGYVIREAHDGQPEEIVGFLRRHSRVGWVLLDNADHIVDFGYRHDAVLFSAEWRLPSVEMQRARFAEIAAQDAAS